jgi:hypothetical protein
MIPAPAPVAMQSASLQAASPQSQPQAVPVLKLRAKLESQSRDVEARELLESVAFKVQQKLPGTSAENWRR